MEGELASAKKRRDELEKECKSKFDCPVSGIGSLIVEFKDLAAKELAQAEKILGISGGVEDSAPADQEEPPVEAEVAEPPEPVKMSAREALLAREGLSLAGIMKKRGIVPPRT